MHSNLRTPLCRSADNRDTNTRVKKTKLDSHAETHTHTPNIIHCYRISIIANAYARCCMYQANNTKLQVVLHKLYVYKQMKNFFLLSVTAY